MSNIKVEGNTTGDEIAVIGMSGRFPGAASISEFWDNLKNGKHSISFLTDEELKSIDPSLVRNPDFVRVKGGILVDSDCFDASFFQYTPLEALVMDPQLRIFHECAWGALEEAGYDPGAYHGLIGLYAGASSRAGTRGFKTTRAAPLPATIPLAPASKARPKPSGDNTMPS